LRGHYSQSVDRESAYEKLNARAPTSTAPQTAEAEAEQGGSLLEQLGGVFKPRKSSSGRTRESVLEAAAKSAARAMGSEMGRQILRGVLGSLLGTGRRRR
jgi:hypothetical protein